MRRSWKNIKSVLLEYIELEKDDCRRVGPLGSSEHPFERGRMFELVQMEELLKDLR